MIELMSNKLTPCFKINVILLEVIIHKFSD
jgi:hypothetical protein